jgi:hypothetical protein
LIRLRLLASVNPKAAAKSYHHRYYIMAILAS